MKRLFIILLLNLYCNLSYSQNTEGFSEQEVEKIINSLTFLSSNENSNTTPVTRFKTIAYWENCFDTSPNVKMNRKIILIDTLYAEKLDNRNHFGIRLIGEYEKFYDDYPKNNNSSLKSISTLIHYKNVNNFLIVDDMHWVYLAHKFNLKNSNCKEKRKIPPHPPLEQPLIFPLSNENFNDTELEVEDD